MQKIEASVQSQYNKHLVSRGVVPEPNTLRAYPANVWTPITLESADLVLSSLSANLVLSHEAWQHYWLPRNYD